MSTRLERGEQCAWWGGGYGHGRGAGKEEKLAPDWGEKWALCVGEAGHQVKWGEG